MHQLTDAVYDNGFKGQWFYILHSRNHNILTDVGLKLMLDDVFNLRKDSVMC